MNSGKRNTNKQGTAVVGKQVTCARCKGRGTVKTSGPFDPYKEKQCPACGGAGKVTQS